jgi:hypothetical protein
MRCISMLRRLSVNTALAYDQRRSTPSEAALPERTLSAIVRSRHDGGQVSCQKAKGLSLSSCSLQSLLLMPIAARPYSGCTCSPIACEWRSVMGPDTHEQCLHNQRTAIWQPTCCMQYSLKFAQ